jgi:citrate lyase subunit beta / citryl-CoA lyase
MNYTKYCRSVLCTPASDPHRFTKCHGSGADIRLVDLEDSVAPAEKDKARLRAEEFLSHPAAEWRRCAIRINALTEPDGLRDLLAIREYAVKPAIVLIPKVESPRDIETVARVLGDTCPDTDLHAVVETPRGLRNVDAIPLAEARLRAVIFGSADYSFDIGSELAWEPLAYARARLVNSARSAGVEPIDAPTFALGSASVVHQEAVAARAMGFGGKIAIHPDQVPVLNEAFSPSPELLARARRVVGGARASADGVTVVDGVMAGAPFFNASRRLLEEFGAREATAR